MANTYNYIDAQGKSQTVQANSSQEALSLAPNIASNSGVQLNPVIDTGVLSQDGTQPTLPAPTPTTDYAAYVAGLPNLSIAPVGAGVGAQEASVSTLTQRLAADNQKLLGQGSEQLRLEQEQGLPTMNTELATLKGNYEIQKAAFDKAINNFQSGQVGTQELSTGKVAQVQRNAAVDLTYSLAQINAKEGDIEAANANVEKALKLEFDPIRQDIENTKTFLDLNYQNLDRADQKAAQALQIQLDAQNRELDLLYSLKKSAAEEVIKNGATSTQIDALKNAKTTGELIAAFGTGIIAGATPSLANGQPNVVGQLTSIINLSGKDVPQASKALGVLSSVQKLATANQEGNFIGEGPNRSLINLRSGDARTEFVSNKADLSGIKSAVAIWVSGATLSEQQAEDVLKLVPNVNDTDFAIREKLNNLSLFMQNQAQAELAAKGISFTPVKIDYFASPVDNYISSAVQEVTDPYQLYLQTIYGQ